MAKAASGKASPRKGDEQPLIGRLHKLVISNYRCVGSTPLEVELDDIVVLVGPNNAGKSTVLRAYALAMSEGSNAAKLELGDFPNAVVDPAALPCIELHTVVADNKPGPEWIGQLGDGSGEECVKERWLWSGPSLAPKREGYNVTTQKWDDRVPWGAPGVANSRRPQPHHIEAFASPERQAEEITNLLVAILRERATSVPQAEDSVGDGDEAAATPLQKLLAALEEVQSELVAAAQTEIEEVQDDVSALLGKVFAGHVVRFDARSSTDLDKAVSLFKSSPALLMGRRDGHLVPIDKQGSGARRTLLWAALQATVKHAKKNGASRPQLLLLDEPELCLHPGLIRSACRVLYDLPNGSNWQVMTTTHSPFFVDFARDNTTIVRVERDQTDVVSGSTVFRPARAKLDDNDRKCLQMLNMCDPHVSEFLFGGRPVVVEGDTEYTAFMRLRSMYNEKYSDVHIIRARGKSTIVPLIKVLNHFGAPFAVLHDADRPRYTRRDGRDSANPAWAHNQKILDVTKSAPTGTKVRLVASLADFEQAAFGEHGTTDKPYVALQRITDDEEVREHVALLLDALLDHAKPLPAGWMEWADINALEAALPTP